MNEPSPLPFRGGPLTPPNAVEVSITEFQRLKNRSQKLEALEAAGVDNWEGYSHAMQLLAEWYPEDNDE